MIILLLRDGWRSIHAGAAEPSFSHGFASNGMGGHAANIETERLRGRGIWTFACSFCFLLDLKFSDGGIMKWLNGR